MTFNADDAQNLMEEVQAAITERNKKLSKWDEMVDRYQGPDRAKRPLEASPENVEFQFIARRMPQMAFDLPAVRADSPRMDLADDVMNFDRALSRWMHSSNMRQVVEQTAVDFNLHWACIWVNRRRNEESGEIEMHDGEKAVPYWPEMIRVSPRLAFKDPRGSNPYDYRFVGRPIVVDREDLLERCDQYPDEGWNRAAIEAMTDDSGLDKAGRRRDIAGPTRKEVTYYEVWVADAKIDWEKECLQKDGTPWPEEKRYLYSGKVYSIATTYPANGGSTNVPDFIRKPYPYFGPSDGPAVFFGEHVVPDDPDFMSTLTPNASSVRFLNQAITALNRGIKSYKRLTFVNDIGEGLEQKIVEAPDLTVHTVSGLDSSMIASHESGGITNQIMESVVILRDRCDRGLGMDDAQYGRADGDASATAVAVAASSSGALSERAQAQFVNGLRRALQKVGHYLWYDEEFAIDISLQEAVELGDDPNKYVDFNQETGEAKFREQPRVYGGTDKERSYKSLELTIEPYSMERMSPQRASLNAKAILELASVLGPLYAEIPGLRGSVIQKALARYTRIPEIEYMFDFKVMAEMYQSRTMAEAAAAMDQTKPQLSGDNASPSKPKVASAQTQGAQQPRVGQAPKMVKPGGLEGRATGGQAGEQARQSATKGAA